MSPARNADRLDQVLVALADPKRRAILRRLAHSEARVTELAAPFDVSLNAISKHIKLLERAGLVQRKQIGREHLLRFRPDPLGEVQDWIASQKAFWQAGLGAMDAMFEQADSSLPEFQEDELDKKIEVKVTHRFKASAERVYDAWLDPEKVRIWIRRATQSMGLSGDIRQIEIDPRVGGKFLFTDMRDGTEARHWGTYLELDRPRKIVFTWIVDASEEPDPSIVTLTIQPQGTGCLATITHAIDAKWADYVQQTENGWSRMLQATAELLGD